MVALVAAVGGLHLAQQGVHFVQRELAVGAHGAVAGHGGQDFIVARCTTVVASCAPVRPARCASSTGRLRQAGGHGAHGQGLGEKGTTSRPSVASTSADSSGRRDFLRRGGEGGGISRAGWRCARLCLGLQAFVDDALVRGVHVHHHHALAFRPGCRPP